MNSILVDTSVWIDFFNNKIPTEKVKILNFFIEEELTISICPIIYQEILQGVRNEVIFEEIKEYLNSIRIFDNDIMEVSNIAVNIYRTSRKSGITIRKSNDCLIAAYAILNNTPILHQDRDFQYISQFTTLKII